MAITSTDTQNLISAQMGMFASAAAYSGSISQQYGTSQNPPQGGGGGGAAFDPRTPAGGIFGAQAGESFARTGVNAFQGGMTALSFAGMFSSNPALKVFDPFSVSLSAGNLGWKSGISGGGSAGTGVARAVGFGGATFGGYMAAGSAINWASNQVLAGAKEHMERVSMLSLHGNRQALPLMGGLDTNSRSVVASSLSGLSNPGGFSSSGINDMTQYGLSEGMFRGAGNVDQLQSKVKEMAQAARQVINALGMTVNDGVQALQHIQQFQGLGFYGTQQATSAISGMANLKRSYGLDSGSLMESAGVGAGLARRSGLHGSAGVAMVGNLSSQIGQLNMAGMVSTDHLREMAGGAPISQAIPMLSQQFAGAAMGVGQSPLGRHMLSALIDPDTGHIDTGRANLFANNVYSGKDLRRMSRRNMRNRSVRDAMSARSDSLFGELSSELGPLGLLRGMGNAAALDNPMSGRPEDAINGLLQQYSGLGEQQASLLSKIANSPGLEMGIRSRLQKEAQKYTQDISRAQHNSVDALVDRLADRYVEPFKQPLRQLGQRLSSAGEAAATDSVNWFMGGRTPSDGYTGPRIGSKGAPGGPIGAVYDFFGVGDGYNPRSTDAALGIFAAGQGIGLAGDALVRSVGLGSFTSARGAVGGAARWMGGGLMKLARPLSTLALAAHAVGQVPGFMSERGANIDDSRSIGGVGARTLVEMASSDQTLRHFVNRSSHKYGMKPDDGYTMLDYDRPTAGQRLNMNRVDDPAIWQVDPKLAGQYLSKMMNSLENPETVLKNAGIQEAEIDAMSRQYQLLTKQMASEISLTGSVSDKIMGVGGYVGSRSPVFKDAAERAGGGLLGYAAAIGAVDPKNNYLRTLNNRLSGIRGVRGSTMNSSKGRREIADAAEISSRGFAIALMSDASGSDSDIGAETVRQVGDLITQKMTTPGGPGKKNSALYDLYRAVLSDDYDAIGDLVGGSAGKSSRVQQEIEALSNEGQFSNVTGLFDSLKTDLEALSTQKPSDLSSFNKLYNVTKEAGPTLRSLLRLGTSSAHPDNLAEIANRTPDGSNARFITAWNRDRKRVLGTDPTVEGGLGHAVNYSPLAQALAKQGDATKAIKSWLNTADKAGAEQVMGRTFLNGKSLRSLIGGYSEAFRGAFEVDKGVVTDKATSTNPLKFIRKAEEGATDEWLDALLGETDMDQVGDVLGMLRHRGANDPGSGLHRPGVAGRTALAARSQLGKKGGMKGVKNLLGALNQQLGGGEAQWINKLGSTLDLDEVAASRSMFKRLGVNTPEELNRAIEGLKGAAKGKKGGVNAVSKELGKAALETDKEASTEGLSFRGSGGGSGGSVDTEALGQFTTTLSGLAHRFEQIKWNVPGS